MLAWDKFQEEYCVVYGNINLVLNDLCEALLVFLDFLTSLSNLELH